MACSDVASRLQLRYRRCDISRPRRRALLAGRSADCMRIFTVGLTPRLLAFTEDLSRVLIPFVD